MDEQQAPILETAADWVDRLGELTPSERRALQGWLNASPEHARAFARMSRLVSDTALIDALGDARTAPSGTALPPLRRTDRMRSPHTARRLNRRQAMAAGLAGALTLPVAGYWLLGRNAPAPGAGSTGHFASTVGQRRHVALPDGSRLLLDAASRVAFDFTPDRRAIVLEHGAARFDVQHDPARPFEVSTPHARMTALGTSFTVDHLRDASELRVLSGKVALATGQGAQMLVRAREWAMIDARSVTGQGRFDPASGDWQTDWLDAESMPLGSALERLNRYSTVPLALGESRFATLTFSGRFRLDRPRESLALIGALFGLVAAESKGTIYLRDPGDTENQPVTA
ncbi:FecR domain-containing protein [Novosphingobium sp. TCA1]|uniref:FecR family protein n=1 Tax=Novosphingobium sp. TCA1 TaxID=2682474 RepID=UPI001307656E|nr:FecR domain-containing protein [Novosphingobium sp. TCA1]GFE74508.1 sensor [Novosphingobium sp. TCA1]